MITRLPILALLALGLGCSDADARDLRFAGVEVDTTLVVSDDPELAALARALLPELAVRSGLTLSEPVRLVRRSRAELEDFLRVKLDEELSVERENGIVRAYGHLGLVPEELRLREVLLSVYLEQVSGFYDPDSTALYVLDDQDPALLEPLLLHELVHAVQDQTADLGAITDPAVGNDRSKAAQAAIEGHATLVMLEQMTEQLQGRPVDLGEIPDFAGQLRPVLEAARYSYPQLAAAPRVIQEALLLPYLEGAGFVQRLWAELPDRQAPFGEWLPTSTEQLMDPDRLLGESRDEPTELLITLDDGVIVHEDGLGQAEVRILLEEHVGEAAGAAASGWDGDRYVAWERGSVRGLVWVSVWDSPAARDRFVETLEGALDAFPEAATLEPTELRGRPGAVLRVGGRVGFEATPIGAER